MVKLINDSNAIGIRELVDIEFDHVAGGRDHDRPDHDGDDHHDHDHDHDRDHHPW